MMRDAILDDLAYNAPHVTINLFGATPSPTVDNLERGGILRLSRKTSPQSSLLPAGRLVLVLTELGKRIAATRGWSLAEGVLEIPTGRLVYAPGTYAVSSRFGGVMLSYTWYYEPDANLRFLLTLGPLSTWPPSIYPDCLSTDGSSLGKRILRTVALGRDSGSDWVNAAAASEPIQGCSSPL